MGAPIAGWQVLGMVMQEAGKHPAVAGLVKSTWSDWNNDAVKAEIAQIQQQWKDASAKAGGMMDDASIVAQIIDLHPNIDALIEKTMKAWDGHLTEGATMLQELVAAIQQASGG